MTVLVLQLPALLRWEQHRPGGCRCLCRAYHQDARGPVLAGGCTAAAVPGLLLRVVAGTQSAGPLPVCRPCHAALAALADSGPDEGPSSAP